MHFGECEIGPDTQTTSGFKTTAVQHLDLALSQLAIKNIIMSFIKSSFSLHAVYILLDIDPHSVSLNSPINRAMCTLVSKPAGHNPSFKSSYMQEACHLQDLDPFHFVLWNYNLN